jgi:DNA-binding NarL/FixJ family response regulator
MRKRRTAELSVESNEGGVIPPRLRPVARELANGLENHEIAERCTLAKHTVEDYVPLAVMSTCGPVFGIRLVS